MFQPSSKPPYSSQRQRRKIIRKHRSDLARPALIATVEKALKIFTGASITASTVLVLQLVWIVLRTPRLPPPPLSGVDFVREGRGVRVDGNDERGGDGQNDCAADGSSSSNNTLNEGAVDSDTNTRPTASSNETNTDEKRQKEFRLVLVGDSPVEGIGNTHHNHALGGQTARAFTKLVCREEEYECVRYWSYGKSGLTARGIEEKMVPFLHRVVEDVVRYSSAKDNNEMTGGLDSNALVQEEPAIHAIILLCGVNNVLDPLSTTKSFHSEVRSLLNSIRCHSELENTPLIVLGLPDFAKLPFLPWWPLGFALGLRGRKMQRVLETVVKEFQSTIMIPIPEIQDILGTIGYHRHDSNAECNTVCNRDHDARVVDDGISGPLKMRLCHSLLKYLGDSSQHLDQAKLGSLGIEDFLSDDRFHPGRYGTVLIGHLIAEAYEKMMGGTTTSSKQ